MIIHAVHCPSCGDLIYSRACYDIRYCTCGAIAVDGGLNHQKVLASSLYFRDLQYESIMVNATQEELHNDWITAIDKYGLIKKGE